MSDAIPADIMQAASEAHANFARSSVSDNLTIIIAKAIFAERLRIISRLKEEADLTPCFEDAMVTRSNARLIEADFSYEGAERLLEIEEARENATTATSGAFQAGGDHG
ncbi:MULTISPECIES: hypothetical protein [unclassified Shinella]|uniref:hypothetical protein n=1 Tax=unclassified Shinella TaxID=2643062 RepID=UPI00225C7DBF|nr:MULTISPECIES: hypothetical protein [unclassified Shinella]MCO5139017.1 hypothetical protein [Shinella sp.]MDC7256254.1 hypothetical protein [Shinella sp. YE25]CAI0339111.1 conserved hypothetical protein [Rhizobiaceae bacterium]CAK7257526.1 conserved protein of unknown function [Shinella sp. WSC3-e]